jgi:transglutaminase-like putative cysteine protease
MLPGCSRHTANVLFLYNGPDKQIPADVVNYANGSEQSQMTQMIVDVAAGLDANTRRERMLKAVDFVWEYFEYDNREAHLSFTRTADQLFRNKVLGGCSDYALVQATLFRALNIPSRLVLTADVEWMGKYKTNKLYMTRGHVFIEVYLEDAWYLVDTAYRTFYIDYRPEQRNYPRDLYYVFRGADYWELGIRSVRDVDRLFKPFALQFDPALYEPAGYPEIAI